MLKLIDITKNYPTGDSVVKALRGISLEFRQSEFVSILGPSGCGKTTLLNIVGGLDRYTTGDLLINNKSTKSFKDGNWDSYRNTTIGFVFQSYNLISHLTVLGNVEIALTLSGVSLSERHKRAKEALDKVGLSDQYNKRPNQLSGGQMQRVAIARALVNDPKIILADEPTGAIDSVTSVQITELLKEISKDRLIIMVTHNGELAKEYSTRIIKLKDGEVIDDNNPYKSKDQKSAAADAASAEVYNKGKKSSMSFFTALRLSFNNLRTKKARTIMTSIAGSIGIIGVALVLAISNGMNSYIAKMQSDTLAGFPITIANEVSVDTFRAGNQNQVEYEKFPEEDIIHSYDSSENVKTHKNNLDKNLINYVNNMDTNLYNTISYQYDVAMNLIFDDGLTGYKSLTPNKIGWQELPASKEFTDSQYDLLYGKYPANSHEIVLVVDSRNRLNYTMMNALGFTDKTKTYQFEDFVNDTFEIKLVENNDFYIEDPADLGFFNQRTANDIVSGNKYIALKVVGVIRINEAASSENLLSRGLAYLPSLTQEVLTSAKDSEIAKAQRTNNKAVADFDLSISIMGITSQSTTVKKKTPLTEQQISGIKINLEEEAIGYFGGALSEDNDVIPTGINIYPKSFEAKEQIKAYIDNYNAGKSEDDKIVYTDLAEMLATVVSTLINTISIVLTAFAAISLVVSSIMIGIITYVSVVERTKEIGVLRSLGARKKDISRVFNAETMIIGFVAGVIGIVVTLLLTIPINIIVNNLAGVAGIANLAFLAAIILIVISITLTLFAGFIPSRFAAKKDPVKALRTE